MFANKQAPIKIGAFYYFLGLTHLNKWVLQSEEKIILTLAFHYNRETPDVTRMEFHSRQEEFLFSLYPE